MSYSVTCYKNTGFNAINIPDSPDLLEGMTSQTLPALNILQDWGLSSVRVRVPSDFDISTVDYCKIGNEFYAVGAPQMLSSDVAELPLTYDAVTSAGGPSSITFLDGLTERHTVNDDTMFKYTQDDEYMAPRESLQLVFGGMKFKTTDAEGYNVVANATIDLATLGTNSINNTLSSKTYTDTDGANSVTVPEVPYPPINTGYLLYDSTGSSDTVRATNSPGTEAFNASQEYVKEGMATARALGIESGITAQVAYPANMVDIVEDTASGGIASVRGKTLTESSGLPFSYATADNNRVLYGNFNKYGIISATGAKGEYLPEQINDGNDSPYLKLRADPRADGKPYFRFSTYLSDSSDENFFNSCIEGRPWRNVPLVYTSASNSILDTANFTNSAQQASSAYNYQQAQSNLTSQRQMVTGIASAVSGLAGAAANAADPAKFVSGIADTVMGGINTYYDMKSTEMQRAQAENQYDLQREKELQNFGWSQSVVVPTVMFPFNADVVRDFIGNGVFVYRYRYSDNDITRIDKILTMYGYKDTVPLTSSLFTYRTNFDYVRANGVSIGGDIANWKKALIAQQLNAGVRVWHVKPNPSYYTNNPIA